MEVRQESFDTDDIEQRCMGAGIVPVAMCPDTGAPRVLLGRERWFPVWKGSCRWSGFEGSRKETEASRATAAREFYEESLGTLLEEGTARDVVTRLEARRYWKRIVLCVRSERNVDRYHTTFLMPVRWDPEIPLRFHSVRCSIEHVERLAHEFRHTRPLRVGDAAEDVGPIGKTKDGSVVLLKSADTAPCILRPPWRRHEDVLTATFTHTSDIETWCDLRARLTRAAEAVKHPAVCVRRDDRWNLVQDVEVNRDYLEKDQVRWWSLAELDDVIAGRGQRETERFRPYFLPVLQAVLQSFHCAPCAPGPSDPEARAAGPPPTAPSP